MHSTLKNILIGSNKYRVKAVAFDKDGTLFDAATYWNYMNQLRKSIFIESIGSPKHSKNWDNLMGLDSHCMIDYQGVLATGNSHEKIILVAGLIYQINPMPWEECKNNI